MSTKSKLLLLGVIALVLLVVGRIFLPVGLPEIIVAPERIGLLFGAFPLTNTIIAAWVTIIVLLVLSWLTTRNLQMVPSGLQNLMEAIIEAFMQPVEAIAGPHNARRFFPLVFTIFLFVMTANWLGLFPGFGTLGIIERGHAHDQVHQATDLAGAQTVVIPPANQGEQHADPAQVANPQAGEVTGTFVPFLRGATTDINMTLAIALVAMTFVEIMGIRALGAATYASKFINVGDLLRGRIGMGLIGLFVGLLELVAEFARIISFTFRLFGNIFAGEVLLVVVAFLLPWVATVPFLGLELFVGFIQAFVFAMLTVVFAATAMTPPHGGEHHEGAGAGAHQSHH